MGPASKRTRTKDEPCDIEFVSEQPEQVFVRHAFRFWMGRNETINDAPVLQAAHKAYRDNGGSMKALLTSLLTSDAFIYRRVEHR